MDVSKDRAPEAQDPPVSALAAAAQACAAWSAQPGVHPPRMQAAALALDALLADAQVRAGIAERAAALGVRGADPIEDWVRGHVTHFTARMVRDRRLLHPGDSPTLAAAVADAREALWAELRDQLTDLRRVSRVRAAEVAPPANASYMEKRRHAAALEARGRADADGDWQRFGAFVRLCEALGGELPERRLVFAQVADLLMNFAVDTFNHRKQRAFGHAVFRWLLAYGHYVGNAETITLLQKNVRVGA